MRITCRVTFAHCTTKLNKAWQRIRHQEASQSISSYSCSSSPPTSAPVSHFFCSNVHLSLYFSLSFILSVCLCLVFCGFCTGHIQISIRRALHGHETTRTTTTAITTGNHTLRWAAWCPAWATMSSSLRTTARDAAMQQYCRSTPSRIPRSRRVSPEKHRKPEKKKAQATGKRSPKRTAGACEEANRFAISCMSSDVRCTKAAACTPSPPARACRHCAAYKLIAAAAAIWVTVYVTRLGATKRVWFVF